MYGKVAEDTSNGGFSRFHWIFQWFSSVTKDWLCKHLPGMKHGFYSDSDSSVGLTDTIAIAISVLD
jgi:hypothetical protein